MNPPDRVITPGLEPKKEEKIRDERLGKNFFVHHRSIPRPACDYVALEFFYSSSLWVANHYLLAGFRPASFGFYAQVKTMIESNPSPKPIISHELGALLGAPADIYCPGTFFLSAFPAPKKIFLYRFLHHDRFFMTVTNGKAKLFRSLRLFISSQREQLGYQITQPIQCFSEKHINPKGEST